MTNRLEIGYGPDEVVAALHAATMTLLTNAYQARVLRDNAWLEGIGNYDDLLRTRKEQVDQLTTVTVLIGSINARDELTELPNIIVDPDVDDHLCSGLSDAARIMRAHALDLHDPKLEHSMYDVWLRMADTVSALRDYYYPAAPVVDLRDNAEAPHA